MLCGTETTGNNAELKQQATMGNNWNWKESYKLDKIAKLIKRAFFDKFGQLMYM